jgi:hypothetical protein
MTTTTNVSTPKSEVNTYRARVQVVHDLLGGQDAMRAAGSKYLRKFSGEPEKKWEVRVACATLFNAFERTLAYLTGQVFSKDVALDKEKGTSTAFDDYQEDIDGEGNNLTVWAKRFFHRSIADGFGIILVDSESVQISDDGKMYLSGKDENGNDIWRPLTAKAGADIGLRPKLVQVRAENVLGWRFEDIGGQKTLTMLRLLETYNEPGQWDCEDQTKEQVRVLTPGHYEIWRRASDREDAWAKVNEGALPGDSIHVAFYRPGKPIGELTCASALEALAEKNVEHWQKQAEHNELMHSVRGPGHYIAGADSQTEVPFGPGILSKIPIDAKIGTVAVDPASVEASRQELLDIQAQMALFGLQLLMPQTGDVTATEKALSAAESDSTLKGWAVELKDALEEAFVHMAEFMGEGIEAPSIIVNTEFRPLLMDDATVLQGLADDVTHGRISRETYLREKKRRGVFQDDFDVEQENDRITMEQRAGTFTSAAASAFAGMNQGPAEQQEV